MNDQRKEERIWSSRKFLSAWALTILSSVLLMYKQSITDQVWGSTISIVWLGYFAGNVGAKFADRRKY